MKKIFCIGLGRTGTTTFQDCMQILGYKHRGWLGPELGLMAMLDFKSIRPTIELYDSFDDYPFPLFYRELNECYPESLFILTKRKTATTWADSVIRESNRKILNDSENIWYEGALNKPDRREVLIEKYENHIKLVTQYFSRSDNLLTICWEEGDAWEKLCKFLDKPVPSINFPHRNKGKSLQGSMLIDHLVKQKCFNKIFLELDESQDVELREYALRALKKVILEKENARINPIEKIKKSIYRNIQLKAIK